MNQNVLKSFGVPQSEDQQDALRSKVGMARYWIDSRDLGEKQDYNCKCDGYILEIPQNPKSKVRFAVNIAKIPRCIEWNDFVNHVIEFSQQAFESHENHIIFYRSVTLDAGNRAQIHWPNVYLTLEDRKCLLKSLSTWVGFDVVKYQFAHLSVPGSMIDDGKKRYLCFGVYKDGKMTTRPSEIDVKFNDILITCHEIDFNDFSRFKVPEPKSINFIEEDPIPTIAPVQQQTQRAIDFSDSDEEDDSVFSLKNTIKRLKTNDNQMVSSPNQTPQYRQEVDEWDCTFPVSKVQKKTKQQEGYVFDELPFFVLNSISRLTPEKGHIINVSKGDYRTNVWFVKTAKRKLGHQCVMGALHRKGDWNTFAISILSNGTVRVKCKNPDSCSEKKWVHIGKIQKKSNGDLKVVNSFIKGGNLESDDEDESMSISSHISNDSLNSSTASTTSIVSTNSFSELNNSTVLNESIDEEDPFGYVALEPYCPDKLRELAMRDTILALKYINRYYCYATSLIYARRNDKITWETMTEHNMMSSLKNIRTKKKHRSLTEMWLKWALRRECFEIMWKPTLRPDSEHLRILNLYSGLEVKPSKLPYDEMMKAVEPLLFHIRYIWAQGDEKLERFFLYYFAHIFQKPDVKTGIALVLTSSQGKGKSIIFEEIFQTIFNDLLGIFSKSYLVTSILKSLKN
jgi:hypothetical protein